jgi:hypothetical protein
MHPCDLGVTARSRDLLEGDFKKICGARAAISRVVRGVKGEEAAGQAAGAGAGAGAVSMGAKRLAGAARSAVLRRQR